LQLRGSANHGGAESGTQSYSAGVLQKNSASDTVCSSKTSKKEIRLWLQGGEEQEPECVWVERRTRRRVSSSGNRIFGRGGMRTYFETTRVGWKQPGTAIRPLKITVLSRTAFHQKLSRMNYFMVSSYQSYRP